jgi:hypothetical protein
MNDDQRKDETPSIPEAAPDREPVFDEPERPAPKVVDAPGRNTEF